MRQSISLAVRMTSAVTVILLASCQPKSASVPATSPTTQAEPSGHGSVAIPAADRSKAGEPQKKASETPSAKEPAVKEPSPKAATALAALEKLGIYVSRNDWDVNLMLLREADKVDKAVALLADLDRVNALTLDSNATDAHLAVVGKLQGVQKLVIQRNDNVSDKGLASLKGLTSLKELALYEASDVTRTGVANLAALKGLERLTLFAVTTEVDGLKALTGLPALRHLNLRFSFSTNNTHLALAVIGEMKNLRSLDISGGYDLTEDALKPLAGLTELESLQLAWMRMPDAGLRHLSGLTKLTTLNLSESRFGDVAMKEVGKLTTLRDLDLSVTPVTDDGLAHLGGLTKLTKLNLAYTKVTGRGLKQLAGCKDLEELGLFRCEHFTGEGLNHLAKCDRLKEIDLTMTGITDAGLVDIKTWRPMRALLLPPYGAQTLGDTDKFWRDPHPERLTDRGLKTVGEMTDLERLSVSGSGPTDAGLAHLTGLKGLRTLQLGVMPNIKGPGLQHLRGLPLETLVLRNTGVTDEHLKHLKALTTLKKVALPKAATAAAAEHLKGMTHLTTVIVPRDWPADAVKAVEKVLPKADVTDRLTD
jgi:internalin A